MKSSTFGFHAAVLTLLASTAAAPAAAPGDAALAARVAKVLAASPVIDGHNDLPSEIRDRFDSDVLRADLRKDATTLPRKPGENPLMTDIPRARAGHLGGQFWSVWVPNKDPNAMKLAIEEIDIIKRMAAAYPDAFEMAYTADDIVRIQKKGRIASLIGMEGGDQIDGSLAALRQFYALGARYLTLTHATNTKLADSATDTPVYNGLSPLGREAVKEMNRLGMAIDLSHVSPATMKQVLELSRAPVIFSHSGARALIDHPRDVPDDVLALVARNRGIVMVNFYPGYVSQARAKWDADRAAEQTRYNAPPFGGLYIGQPERAKEAMAAWEAANPRPKVTVAMVADHIDHIAKVAGKDAVGLGSDFDGIPDTPEGLDGVHKYPALFVELARRGWSDADLAKLSGGNLLRVLREIEQVAKQETSKKAG
ncbi:membrane dipeptidase [Sphingomonas sp. DBB INV C78]|uniref:dipeptidase n=1 Tax=Sphingomonas sp. DBB INV C78 TaxID=3349434 RepID=UPI0036D2A6FD